jgi:hypothetical protein
MKKRMIEAQKIFFWSLEEIHVGSENQIVSIFGTEFALYCFQKVFLFTVCSCCRLGGKERRTSSGPDFQQS